MSFDIGINFRATAGYVTDGPNETYCLAEAYPVTRLVGGLMVTFGWEDSISGNTRDRDNTTADRRLAGINFSTVAGTRFRIDLPASGAVSIHCAAGDGYGGGGPADWQFKDGTTLLGSLTQVPNGVQFTDATNVLRDRSVWPTDEAPLSVTFAGTVFRLAATDASVNRVAHLRVVQATSPPPPPPGVTDYAAGYVDSGITDYVASL